MTAFRDRSTGLIVGLAAVAALAGSGAAFAQAGAAGAAAPPPQPPSAASGPTGPARAPVAARISVPRIAGRLTAADIGLVINTADPYSVAVGGHYAAARGLSPQQVLRVALPTQGVLTRDEFAVLQRAISSHFGASTQALALAWVAPHSVECNAITGALALGFDPALCANSCAPSRPSPYFNSSATRPLERHAMRLSMLLAAPDVAQARAMIDRGVESDGSLALRGRPPVSAMLLATDDPPRRVRMALYPQPGLSRPLGLDIRVEPAAALATAPRVVVALTGSAGLGLAPGIDWVPGALADHLTSRGGQLTGENDQSSVLEWIASGATASHGAVSEPCNHLQKFPHPQVLLLNYVQGSTAIEAYWRSVAWPQQSLFVGEPLAAPFSAASSLSGLPADIVVPKLSR